MNTSETVAGLAALGLFGSIVAFIFGLIVVIGFFRIWSHCYWIRAYQKESLAVLRSIAENVHYGVAGTESKLTPSPLVELSPAEIRAGFDSLADRLKAAPKDAYSQTFAKNDFDMGRPASK